MHTHVLWTETLPGGAHWSGVVRRGVSLVLRDLAGRANVAAMLYHFPSTFERYNMPDTLKGQHTAHLTAGHILYTDMGRALCSLSADSLGWHDPLGGIVSAAEVTQQYGETSYQVQRNSRHQNARDGLLTELGKWGLSRRDVLPAINFFSRVTVEGDGTLRYELNHSYAGAEVTLRFEMDTLVILSAAPHRLDPRTDYRPSDVLLQAIWTGPAPATDPCRQNCEENTRALTNTERYYAGSPQHAPPPSSFTDFIAVPNSALIKPEAEAECSNVEVTP